MILDMIRPEYERVDSVFSISKTSEKLDKQPHRKLQWTPEPKLKQPRETFSFKASINLGLDCIWIFGLKSLEACNSIFLMTRKKKQVRTLCIYFDEFSFTAIKMSLRKSLVFHKLLPSIYRLRY